MFKKHIKLLLIFNIVLFLPLVLIDSIYATAWDKAQTSKSGIVDMFEVTPEYLQVNSTAENRDIHVKRNERSLGTGTQYYFYLEGGTVTVSLTTSGILRIGNAMRIGTSTVGIGTTTPSTALEVIGTVTATGFSGNGAGLTNLAGVGNVSYPVNLAGGTETTNILPINQGGSGTNTAAGAASAIGVGTEDSPEFTRIAIGTTTLQGALNAVGSATFSGTITAAGFSGNGAGLTNLATFNGGNITGTLTTTGGAGIGVGTTTPSTIVQVIGTVTATGFSGNGAGLTNLASFNGGNITGTLTTTGGAGIGVGTTTPATIVQVIGTVTATGFSGNGAGLTNVSTAFSNITGSATSAQMPADPNFTGTLTATNFSGSGAGITGITVSGTLTVSAIRATSTANTFGTTTQHNNSIVTLFGSSSSPLSIVVHAPTSWSGTNTTAIMTGTNTPAPNEVIASFSAGTTYAAYNLFDDTSNKWSSSQIPVTVRYDYGTSNTRTIAQYNIRPNGLGNIMTSWTFEGNQTPQNDATWVVLDPQSGVGGWVDLTFKEFPIAVGSRAAYRAYRWNITGGTGGWADAEEMQLISIVERINQTAFYVNGSATVIIGTTTANSTTTPGYKFQIDGSALATSWGVTCYEAIKSIIGTGADVIAEGYNAVMGTPLYLSHPKIRNDITLSHAEDVVRNEYVNSFAEADFQTFKTDRIGSYTTVVAGSSSVNWKKFKEDFEVLYVNPRNDEFYALPDKNKRVKDKKIALESDTSITNISPVSDDPLTPTIFKRSDPKILDIENQIGALIGAAQKLDEMVKTQDAEIKDLKKKMRIP